MAAVGGLLARAGVVLWGRPQQQQRACGSRVGPLPFLLPAARCLYQLMNGSLTAVISCPDGGIQAGQN